MCSERQRRVIESCVEVDGGRDREIEGGVVILGA